MNYRPAHVWGSIIAIFIFAVLFAITQFVKNSNRESKLSLDYVDNKFKLNFQINDQDKDNFATLLKNLEVSEYSPQEPIFFELDSSSSARFAFQMPLEATIIPDGKRLEIAGTTSQSLYKNSNQTERIKFPKNVELVIFANDLQEFVPVILNLPKDQTQLFINRLGIQKANYFITMNSAEDTALYFKSDIALTDLDKAENQTADETPIYKAKIEPTNEQEATPVLFENQGFKVLASSLESAKEILNNKDTISPWSNETELDLGVYLRPKDEFNAEKFLSTLTQNGIFNEIAEEKSKNAISKIEQLDFLLKGTHFSALIKLK